MPELQPVIVDGVLLRADRFDFVLMGAGLVLTASDAVERLLEPVGTVVFHADEHHSVAPATRAQGLLLKRVEYLARERHPALRLRLHI